MHGFLSPKSFLIYAITASLLLPSLACSYKPAYLDRSKKTRISERWQVEKINPSRLSPDEKAVYETMGSPQYIRFYRRLSPDRERVYEWVYTAPIGMVTFIDGRKVAYTVLDDNPSSLNEYQKHVLFWGGITAGAVVALGILYYYIFAK